jgi:c-di-AMP phosphodiesterase-like protein
MGGLKRVLSPGNQMFFVLLVAFAGGTAFFSVPVAAAEGALIVLAALIYRRQIVRRRADIVRYIEQITTHIDTSDNTCPIPMLILRVATGEMIWANDGFMAIAGLKERLFTQRIGDFLPGLDLKWLGKEGSASEITLRERRFTVMGNMIRQSEKRDILAALYFVDITELTDLRREYRLSRPSVLIVMVDNYEECVKNLTESQKSNLQAAVDERLSEWAVPLDGILRKLDRDRYLLIVEERELALLIERRFAVLNSIRSVVGAANLPVTLSIGVGRDGSTLSESFSFAQLAVDMALSRGGDQAVVKNRFSFDFFGGRSNEIEVRTKVKSRIVAASLSNFISDSTKVLVMGHSHSDIDSLGAAAGVVCLARKRGKQAYIVIDEKKTLAGALLSKLKAHEKYVGVFIDPQTAMILADNKTLLVVVDCSRPDLVESEELLRSMNRVAVIDHHRRSANYIENAVLLMHEPSASSACELVSELAQYICQPSDILRLEAEAMMAGIVLDTKGFTMQTGMNTFEAAAFLRGAGADPVEIKKIFQNDMRSSLERYELVSNARIVREGITVAVTETETDRAVAAQAADEMLNIAGIDASFVIYPFGGDTAISGRSLGGINVQMILEGLGGGGHRTVAGAQLKNATVMEALDKLVLAIDRHCEENGVAALPPQAL